MESCVCTQAGSNGTGTSTAAEDADDSSSGVGFWQKRRDQSYSATASTAAPAGADTTASAAAAGGDTQPPESARPPRGTLQMLYIQMEFCPRTLRQVLDEGPLDAEDCWQVQTPTNYKALYLLLNMKPTYI